MAELVVSALSGAIFSCLTPPSFRRPKLDEKRLYEFRSYLLGIDEILDAAESKEYDQNKELKLWLDRLHEVSYELEDLLNEVATEGLRRQLEAKSWNIKYRVRGIISIKMRLVEKYTIHRQKWITAELDDMQRNKVKFGLEYYAPTTARKPDQLSASKEGPEDESQARRSSVKKDKGRKRFQRPTSSLMVIPKVIAVSRKVRHLSFAGDLNAERCQAICGAKLIRISRCPCLEKCSPLRLPPSAKVEISECPLLQVPVTDGNKMQLKTEVEIASKFLEHRTDVSSQSHSSPPELSMLSTELAHEKQVHEGNSRREKILDRPSTSRLSKVEELQLPDTDVVQSTDVSITINRPPLESPTRLTEDSSAKHGGALVTSSPAIEISSDTDTDDPINDEGEEAHFRRIEKLDRPSTSGLQEIEELQLTDSDVVLRTVVSATSNRPPPEFSKHLTEDSSIKHGGASRNCSASTEISSDTDDPINDEGDKAEFRRIKKLDSTSRLTEVEEKQLPDTNVVQSTDVSITINRPPLESPTRLTEDSSAKHGGALVTSSPAIEISSDTDTDTDDPINDEESLEDISSPEQESLNVSEISQFKRLPPNLYSLKIEACQALESLPEELMNRNLQHFYVFGDLVPTTSLASFKGYATLLGNLLQACSLRHMWSLVSVLPKIYTLESLSGLEEFQSVDGYIEIEIYVFRREYLRNFSLLKLIYVTWNLNVHR
ncbi:hypothetical protein QYF36_025893 [Acer negundo]|nr:hypothetical protein QYF36_025893 [Acer negundo]